MPEAISLTIIILLTVLAVIGCIFVWMTTPGKFRWFDIPAIYCHRGYHGGGIPENSLSAFAKCKEKDLAAELDVRTTADGGIVVFHDENALRMCGIDKNIRDMSTAEATSLCLKDTEEKIPLYSDVLSTLGGVPIYCEVKTDSLDVDEKFLEKLCVLIDSYEGQTVIVSFNPYVLRWFREHRPEMIRGQLSMNFRSHAKKGEHLGAFALGNLMTNFIAKPDFISYKFNDKTLGMILCRLYGTRMVGWTVESMEDVEDAAYHGFSSFVGEDFDMTEV